MLLAAAALAAPTVHADVTMQTSLAFDLAGVVKAHGTTVERTTSDKQREDSEMHCEGFMSLFCGNAQSGQIVRLDRELDWQLNPKKKTYLETPFPTPEERAMAQKKMDEMFQKMKECQKEQPRAKPAKDDTSNCEMSPPKIDMRTTDEHATIAGHDARKSSVKMSQTCTDKKTGEVCEYVYGFDTWLTTDEVAGLSDVRNFQRAHLAKLGLDANNPAIKGALQQFMASYAGTMKDMQTKAASLKGYPLRTTFRLIIGGDGCSKGKSSADQTDSGAGGGGLSSLAAGAIGGLFARRNSGNQGSTAAATAANAAPALPDGYAQVVAFTVETTSVDTGPIPADQFELPAGWVPEQRKVAKDQEYTCPTAKGN